MPIKHGQPITREQGNKHFETFIRIKKRVVTRFKQLLDGDDEAVRFYCGRKEGLPTKEDIAYIFDKEAIEKILVMLEKNTAHGIIVFSGVREKKDSQIGNTNTFNDVNGRPTVMLFPFAYETPENKNASRLFVALDDGTEHPGTAGDSLKRKKNDRTEFEPSNEFELPEVFEVDEIHLR
jgi:hypothetical protein